MLNIICLQLQNQDFVFQQIFNVPFAMASFGDTAPPSTATIEPLLSNLRVAPASLENSSSLANTPLLTVIANSSIFFSLIKFIACFAATAQSFGALAFAPLIVYKDIREF